MFVALLQLAVELRQQHLACGLFSHGHLDGIPPCPLIDRFDFDHGLIGGVNELPRGSRCRLMRHPHNVTTLTTIQEEAKDGIRQIAETNKVAENVTKLAPIGDRLRSVQRSPLQLAPPTRQYPSARVTAERSRLRECTRLVFEVA